MAQQVSIPKPDHRRLKVTVIGDQPLLSHKFSERCKKAMLAKQQRRANGGKESRDPEMDFKASLYRVDGEDGEYGFPAAAFKKAMVSACRFVDGMAMTVARGALHVMGDIIPLAYDELKMREDTVVLNGRTRDLRYRGEFRGWSAELTILYDASVVSAEQVGNLLNRAGFGVGVGDWRPEKNGSFGMFHVDGAE